MDISDEYNMLNSIIGNLVKEDQDFIDMFYRKGFSQRQISAELNISEATVSRMHSKIIGQLKEKIKMFNDLNKSEILFIMNTRLF